MVLMEAGIPYWEMKNMEIFELMDERERGLFIKGWRRRKEWLVREIKEAMEDDMRDGVDGGDEDDAGLGQTKGKISDGDEDEYLRMQELERRRSLETVWSELASSEEPGETLWRQQSFFGSLGGVFRKHTRGELSGSDGIEYSGSQVARSRKLLRTLGRSIRSLRHLFEGRTRGFRRNDIGEGVFVQ